MQPPRVLRWGTGGKAAPATSPGPRAVRKRFRAEIMDRHGSASAGSQLAPFGRAAPCTGRGHTRGASRNHPGFSL